MMNPYPFCNPFSIFYIIKNLRVWHIEALPESTPQNLGAPFGFFPTHLLISLSALLPTAQIDDTTAVSLHHALCEQPRGSNLNVIRMRAKGKYVCHEITYRK